jgi:hypothetical protein
MRVQYYSKGDNIMATAEVKDFLYNKNEDIYILTPEEEQMIDEAEAEPCISNEEAQRRTRECLNKLAQNFV